jgi:membrane peptidoglycan carboxypeptidase
MRNFFAKIGQFLKNQVNTVHARKRLFFFTVVTGTFLYLFWGIPLPTNLTNSQPVSTRILDRNGKLIYEIYSEQRRSPVNLSDLPKFVTEATISIEDKDFYKHQGISYTGIIRGLFRTVFKHETQGGSTITQQLVKNGLLSNEKTIRRKAQELV